MISDIIAQLLAQTKAFNEQIDYVLQNTPDNLGVIKTLNEMVASNAEAVQRLSAVHLNDTGNTVMKAELNMLIKALESCINDNPGIIPLLAKYGISSVKEEDMVNVTGNNNSIGRRYSKV